MRRWASLALWSGIACGTALPAHAQTQGTAAGGAASLASAPPPPETTPSSASSSAPSTEAAIGSIGSTADAAVLPDPRKPVPLGENEKKKKKKKKKEKKPGAAAQGLGGAGEFTIKGRVLALAELQQRERETVDSTGRPVVSTIESLDLSVPKARLAVQYQAPLPWLSAEVEVDFSGKPDLKDGYVQARERHFSVRAGQFKMPVSAADMESSWVLPTVRRGLIHDVLADWLDVGGRRPGVLVGWRGRGGVRPRLSLGVFQGSGLQSVDTTGRDTYLLEGRDLSSQSLIARAQIEPIGGVALGTFYEHRVGAARIGEHEHYWTLGADVTLDRRLGALGLRLWLDGILGEAFYERAAKAEDASSPTFLSLRALAGLRWGGVSDIDLYVEPFAFAGLLDPDLDVTSDFVSELGFGVNVGLWRRARLTLQAESQQAQRNLPEGYFVGQSADRKALLLQAGVAF